ncbi:MAG: FAD-dependent thymidylate synthase, partial [Deltaproteobacteria bacterium]|nr:FAD-dependent thymidylate synthase [Deltaproteobacteria bacterium]
MKPATHELLISLQQQDGGHQKPQRHQDRQRHTFVHGASLSVGGDATSSAVVRSAPLRKSDNVPAVPETKRPTSSAAEEILGLYFPVLDHGFVSLNDYMGTDECIERAARVSYGYGTRKQSQTRGLLRYLRRHKHTTPSEMVELKFHCCMPIFIARQWIRHRTANVNEYSGRYSLIPMLFYTPEEAQLQTQSKRNNQGRSGSPVATDVHTEAVRRWSTSRAAVTAGYEWMTGEEVARELARIDLPLSTYTQWYWKIDLHNLLHFLTLRVDSHAQWEIQEFGRVMAGMLKRVAPLSYEAWIDYDVCGAHVSRMELDALRALVGPHEQGIQAAGGVLDRAGLTARGLSGREADELLLKLGPSSVPTFDLDVRRAKSAEHFAERFAAAVPKGEVAPQ